MRFSPETIQMMQMAKEGLIDLQKATFNEPTSSTTGFQAYNLIPPIELIPVSTPLANQANWKTATGINSVNLTSGVPQASRNGQVDYTLNEYSATFKTLYMEASATLQARLAGQGYDDVDARATKSALIAHQIEEEWMLLGGNTTSTGIALGSVTGLAVTVSSTSAGSISDATVYANVVPLTIDGVRQLTSYGVGRNNAADVGGVRTVTPVYGSSFTVNLGCGAPATQASVGSMTGSTNQVTVTWNAVQGAAGYAVYVGSVSGAARYVGVSYGTSLVVNARARPRSSSPTSRATVRRISTLLTAS